MVTKFQSESKLSREAKLRISGSNSNKSDLGDKKMLLGENDYEVSLRREKKGKDNGQGNAGEYVNTIPSNHQHVYRSNHDLLKNSLDENSIQTELINHKHQLSAHENPIKKEADPTKE